MSGGPQDEAVDRRIWIKGVITALVAASASTSALARPANAAHQARPTFEQWVAALRSRALARGVSDKTYSAVMNGLKPDLSVYAQVHDQPEFNEALWQYLNRRVSDWRIIAGKERAVVHRALLERVEHDYGVAGNLMLAFWGIESSYGDVITNPKYMRLVIPALAALAYGEPRRRAYWESELLNSLLIIERGWATPQEMIGSWAGAMGHTQWMPEVWLHLGVDYDHDGRISPFGKPDDALAGTARFLIDRGHYRRGEAWGYEVKLPPGFKSPRRATTRPYSKWAKLGVVRADGASFAHPDTNAKLAIPVADGPAFLLGQNFSAVEAYNPAFSYALAVVHLADRIGGGGEFVRPFPGGEPLPTLAEVQEIQRRLTALGFDTGGTDGRVGLGTMIAVRGYQRKAGIEPADGYAGLKLLARLRQGA